MRNAKRTNDIVAALFPSSVRERMFQRNEEGETTKQAIREKEDMNQYLSSINSGSGVEPQNNGTRLGGLQPIADSYIGSVFFLDIAGFTRWSADRTAAEVFQLLESVYEVFDEIADGMGVFKIET